VSEHDVEEVISSPAPGESEASPPPDQEDFKRFAPHEQVTLDGVLCCGQPRKRHRRDLSRIALRTLIDLVRQVIDWTDPSGDDGRYLCDYRFLVLDALTDTGFKAFVQIWSEPFDELIVEVGPGDREDPARRNDAARRHDAARQAFADRIRESMLDRGFESGRDGANFKKTLPSLAAQDSPRVARELLAILMDVLGYDGRNNLNYQLQQHSHLSAAHVVTGLSCSELQRLCMRWGLRSRVSPDEDNLVEAHDLHQDLQLNLFYPQPHRKGSFWEVHCVVFLDLDPERADALVTEVNGKAHLMKAFGESESGDPTRRVRLSFGINLAGGVTLAHLRCQIVEFLELVRRLRRQIGVI
jgi:hypothetical protein